MTPIAVPSGQPVTLAEVLLDHAPGHPGQTWARFRFLAPQIARGTGTVSYDQARPPTWTTCAKSPGAALPGRTRADAARVVISLSDRDGALWRAGSGCDPVFRSL